MSAKHGLCLFANADFLPLFAIYLSKNHSRYAGPQIGKTARKFGVKEYYAS